VNTDNKASRGMNTNKASSGINTDNKASRGINTDNNPQIYFPLKNNGNKTVKFRSHKEELIQLYLHLEPSCSNIRLDAQLPLMVQNPQSRWKQELIRKATLQAEIQS
jgi:hypothetical protein